MSESSYHDIIEKKIEEWQKSILKLEERARKANRDTATRLGQSLEKLNESINASISELRELDQQEDNRNTLAIKEKMLEIFDSVDKELTTQEEKTPFML